MRETLEIGRATAHRALPALAGLCSLPLGPVRMEHRRKSLVQLEIPLKFRSLHIWHDGFAGGRLLTLKYTSIAIL